MSQSGMNRRQFLHTRVTAAGAAAVAGTGTVLVDPKGAWAMSLQALDPHTATTLVLVARELYPHDRLGDIYYAKVVESLDGKAAENKDVGKLLADGVAELDKSEGAVKWVELSPGYRLASLKQLEATPFFQTVRRMHHRDLQQSGCLAAFRLRGAVLRVRRLYRARLQRSRLARGRVREDGPWQRNMT
jgi:hypothetical protein